MQVFPAQTKHWYFRYGLPAIPDTSGEGWPSGWHWDAPSPAAGKKAGLLMQTRFLMWFWGWALGDRRSRSATTATTGRVIMEREGGEGDDLSRALGVPVKLLGKHGRDAGRGHTRTGSPRPQS